MSVVGYARVSSVGQSLDVQLEKLQGYGCDKIYQEKQSGVDANRPQLKACLDYVREGDTLVITKLDRLARSTLDLHRIVSGLNDKGVAFKVLDQSMDTSTSQGRLLFGILATVAQFENEIRRERQADGIRKAMADGKRFGRESKLRPHQVTELREKRKQGVLIRELMDEYELSKATVYRLLRD